MRFSCLLELIRKLLSLVLLLSSTSGQRRQKRKRVPSLTPLGPPTDDNLRSPLAKRKKLAADRRGLSKLKEALTADDLESVSSSNDTTDSGELKSATATAGFTAGSVTGSPKVQMMDDVQETEDSSDSDMSEEDDFLAREMAEWG